MYNPGELKVVTYKKGKPWATDIVRTADKARSLQFNADRTTIAADGKDLSFITVRVLDSKDNCTPGR